MDRKLCIAVHAHIRLYVCVCVCVCIFLTFIVHGRFYRFDLRKKKKWSSWKTLARFVNDKEWLQNRRPKVKKLNPHVT